MAVSKLRFVGKEAGNCLSEFFPVMGIMRLINRVNQYTAGRAVHHIDITSVITEVSRYMQGINLPYAFGYLP